MMRCSHIIRFTLPIFTLLMLIVITGAMKPAADGEEDKRGSDRKMQLPIKKRPSDLANSVSGVDDSAVATTSEDDDGTEAAAPGGLGEAEEAAADSGSPILGLLTANTARNSTAKKIVSQAAMASSFGRDQSTIEVGEGNKKVTWEHFSLNPNESVNLLQGSGSKFKNVFVRNPRKRKLMSENNFEVDDGYFSKLYASDEDVDMSDEGENQRRHYLKLGAQHYYRGFNNPLEEDFARLRQSERENCADGKSMLQKLSANPWNCQQFKRAFERHWWQQGSEAACQQWELLQAHTIRWLHFLTVYNKQRGVRTHLAEVLSNIAVFPAIIESKEPQHAHDVEIAETSFKKDGKGKATEKEADEIDDENSSGILDSFYLAQELLDRRADLAQRMGSVQQGQAPSSTGGGSRRRGAAARKKPAAAAELLKPPKWRNQKLCLEVASLAKFYQQKGDIRSFLEELLKDNKAVLSGIDTDLPPDMDAKMKKLLQAKHAGKEKGKQQ